MLRNYESFIPSAEGILVVNYATPLSSSILWPCLVCSVLVNSDFLTVNYGVKQSQFTKLISEPRASDPEESNETFDRAI